MTPDAIIILSAGTVPCGESSGSNVEDYRSTTYDEGDAFGVLGGLARVQAGAFLSREYPEAILVTTSSRSSNEPSHAAVMKHELVSLGVPPERILLEEGSTNTYTQIQETLRLSINHHWKTIMYVSNEYQIERIKAFVEQLKDSAKNITILYQAAELVLNHYVSGFDETFQKIKTQDSYKVRLISEEKGIAAIRDGSYVFAAPEDKVERVTP